MLTYACINNYTLTHTHTHTHRYTCIYTHTHTDVKKWSRRTYSRVTRRLRFPKLLHRGGRVGATPFSGLLHFTIYPHLIMLSVKQSGIKYHFLSLWYDSTWDWTPVSGTIGEHNSLDQWPGIYNYHHHHHHQVMLIAGKSWLSLSLLICPYRPWCLAGPLDCIRYPYKVDILKHLLVSQLWRAHVL